MFIIAYYNAPQCLHNRLIHTHEIANKNDMKTKLSVIGVILVFSALGLVTYHPEMAYARSHHFHGGGLYLWKRTRYGN